MKKIFQFIGAFLKASNKERLEFIQFIMKRAKQSFIDYWLGHVSVSRHHIVCIDETDKLYTISIIAGRFRRGAWFSNIDAKNIPDIYKSLKECKTKYFQLYLDMGVGCYLDYNFNRFQQKLLLKELGTILEEEEIYED